MAVGFALKALMEALAAATTKEEKFDINQLIKELKLQSKSDRQPTSKSDRQPEIEKANKSKTSVNGSPDKVPNYKDATPAVKYAKEPRKTPRNFPMTPKLTMMQKAKGGEVKKYMGGGSVHKKKNTMATTKGWGASRKT